MVRFMILCAAFWFLCIAIGGAVVALIVVAPAEMHLRLIGAFAAIGLIYAPIFAVVHHRFQSEGQSHDC